MGTVRIAHLSDLHFGAESQHDTWEILKRHLQNEIQNRLIHLVLVTGDIADTPNDELLMEARRELDSLGVKYYVCPGNHDRHAKGNSSRVVRPVNWVINRIAGDGMARFSLRFEGKIPTLENVINEVLQDGTDEWRVRIVGVDSSINADISARGFLCPKDQDLMRKAMDRAEDVDLGLLLFHHQLLPVRTLERNIEPKRISWSDVTRLTALINAGTAMEVLSTSLIDIVLHGHEHAANWGRYSSMEIACGETAIIGAGSATGTVTLKESSTEMMSYNIINLCPDRSADLFVMAYSGGSFRTREQFSLMDAQTMRKHRFLRQLRSEDQPALAPEVVKIIEFTRNGDGIVYQYHTGWPLNSSNEWTLQARNGTGSPSDLNVRFVAPDDDSHDLQPAPLFQRLGVDQTWQAKQVLNGQFFQKHLGQTFRVEESYRWKGGAILTAGQLSELRKTSYAGMLRSDGKEFCAISIKRWFASAMLLVRLPSEFAPDPKSIEVWAIDESNPNTLHPARRDISGGLRVLGRGLYSLTVPYPRKGWRYALSWVPVEKETSDGSVAPSPGTA